jgi:hypothetical protein
MTVGRNDPCPCGSGKKYKNCCLRKDRDAAEARERALAVPPPAPRAAPDFPRPPGPAPARLAPVPEPKDPHEEALEARWEEFEKADYEGRVAIFQRALDEKDLDDEDAFEMLNQIFHDAVERGERGERDRFDALVAALRERLPEVYADNAVFFLSWLLEDAVAASRWEALPALGAELAECGPDDIDVYNGPLDLLAYHGPLPLLVQMHRTSWPRIQDSEDIMDWGISRFAERAIHYEVFDHLEHGGAPDASDAGLLERLAPYDVNPERLVDLVDLVSGKRKTSWALADYDLKAPPRKKRRDWYEDEDEDEDEDEERERDRPVAEGRRRLHLLSYEFVAHLRREEGVPYPKGELAREEIVTYLLRRVDGGLRQGRKAGKHAPGGHPLCPDRATLDHFLGGNLDLLNFRKYRAVVTFELMPAWLRFLEGRGLLSAEQRRAALEQLRPLRESLLKFLEKDRTDPHLAPALRAWGEEAKPAGG